MRIILEFNNQTKAPVKKAFFNAVVKKTLEEADFFICSSRHSMSCNHNSRKTLNVNKRISVSVALVDEAEIKRLNRIYRRKNEVTDVLSFAEHKNAKALESAVDNPAMAGLFLGELVLCYNDIRQYAEKNKTKLDRELASVVSHGVLHLLGFRHGKKMFQIQNKITNK